MLKSQSSSTMPSVGLRLLQPLACLFNFEWKLVSRPSISRLAIFKLANEPQTLSVVLFRCEHCDDIAAVHSSAQDFAALVLVPELDPIDPNADRAARCD